jgi:hypothetical protein
MDYNGRYMEQQFMRTLAGFVVAMMTLVCRPAAAGSFDGNWIGQIPHVR